MSRIGVIVLCMLVLSLQLWTADLALAGRRVALVIGNGAYPEPMNLPNPVNDARAISSVLRKLGFDVIERTNVDKPGIDAAFLEFNDALSGADAALFYYSGHGMQLQDVNYLIPVGRLPEEVGHLPAMTVRVDDVLRSMEAKAQVRIVLLDACRDNPLAEKITRSMAQSMTRSLGNAASGMSKMESSATGTLIAFATSPGMVAYDGTGSHSPFTTALLAHVGAQGVELNTMMLRVRGQVVKDTKSQQVPWSHTSMTDEFYLASDGDEQQIAAATEDDAASSDGATGAGTAARSAAQTSESSEVEVIYWQAIDRDGQGSMEDYKQFLERFPDGLFADVAKRRIELLEKSPEYARVAALRDPMLKSEAGTELTEEELALGKADWREVQVALKSLGYAVRSLDGYLEEATRKAIRTWQRESGILVTGYLTRAQFLALRRIAVAAIDDDPSSAATSSAAPSDQSAGERQSRKPRKQKVTRYIADDSESARAPKKTFKKKKVEDEIKPKQDVTPKKRRVTQSTVAAKVKKLKLKVARTPPKAPVVITKTLKRAPEDGW